MNKLLIPIAIISIVIVVAAFFFGNQQKKSKPTLLEDIGTASEWISQALNSSGYKADFSVESLKEIDRFFDENSKNGKATPDGLLSKNLGQRMFALGCYVGEVIKRNYGGEWITNDNEPNGEIDIQVKLEDSSIILPVHKVMKRFQNGEEDSIYAYGFVLNSKNLVEFKL